MVAKIASYFSSAATDAAVTKESGTAPATSVFKKKAYYGPSLYRDIFNKRDGQREEIRAFLKNILMQLDIDKFFTLIDSILEDPSLNDKGIYEQLRNRIGEASPSGFQQFAAKLTSLSTLKRDLADQVKEVMGDTTNIDGYMEIGYPGRMIRPLKGKFTMTGPKIVITDKERASDLIECGGTRPYQKFIELGDYTPIDESVPSNSLDMVTCFIGLHHAPKEKLDKFVASIQRVLKPGGSFILMDHDAHNEKMKKLCNVVHSIFNATFGVSPEEESAEIRHFESLQHFTNLLDSHGLVRKTWRPPMREGDSSKNCIVRFVKKGKPEETRSVSKSVQVVEEATKGDKKKPEITKGLPPEVRRAKIQTFLTAVEWHNVRLYQGYGAYLEHTAAYFYPHTDAIKGVWKVFADSWNAAREYGSFSEVAFNMYTVMNVLLCLWITLEFSLKGIFNAPLYLLYGILMKEDLSIHLLVKDNGRNFAHIDKRIQVIDDQQEPGIKHIVIPRYLPCTEIMRKLANERIKCVSMAGQKHVMLDLYVDPSEENPMTERVGCKKLYEIAPPPGYHYKTFAYGVDVEELDTVMRSINDRVVKKYFIHDF